MQCPEFPQEFVEKHCPQVKEARHWRAHFGNAPDPEEDRAHAQCAFIAAGCGIKCAECEMFLSPLPPVRAADAMYAPIKQYYRDMAEYEKAMLELGAYI